MSYGDEVDRVILVNPPTHPRPGELLWYQKLAALLFRTHRRLHILVTPMSLLVNAAFVRRLFAPESAPILRNTERAGARHDAIAISGEHAGICGTAGRAITRRAVVSRISTPTLIVSGAEDGSCR